MPVLNTTSPEASPFPVNDRQGKVRPSSSASNASIQIIFCFIGSICLIGLIGSIGLEDMAYKNNPENQWNQSN
jgi:hypothetical protein